MSLVRRRKIKLTPAGEPEPAGAFETDNWQVRLLGVRHVVFFPHWRGTSFWTFSPRVGKHSYPCIVKANDQRRFFVTIDAKAEDTAKLIRETDPVTEGLHGPFPTIFTALTVLRMLVPELRGGGDV